MNKQNQRRRGPAGLFSILAVAAALLSASCAWATPGGGAAPGPGPSAAGSAPVEIVARVNGEPVSRDELQRLLADPLTRQLAEQKSGVRKPDDEVLNRFAWQRLVHRRLMLQEAARRNFTVAPEELDQAVIALRRRFQDLRGFGEWMGSLGLNDQSLFEAIRAEMLLARIKGALAEGVRPTDQEVRAYYDDHKKDLHTGEEVRLRIIAVKSRAAAEEILAALRKGEKFGRLARQHSLGTRAAKGGDMGWVDSATLPSPLRETVGVLKVGDVSSPVQKSADEFLLVGMQDRRPGRGKTLAEARPEIEKRLLAAKQQEAVETWLKEQEKRAKIEVLQWGVGNKTALATGTR